MTMITPSAPTHDRATNGATAPKGRNALIDNVDVTVETYLAATSMTVAQLNALSVNGVVALDATLNSLVELRVNGIVIAHGELVAVGDKFGVRVTAVSV